MHQKCLVNPVPTLKDAILRHYDAALESMESQEESDKKFKAEICVEAAQIGLFYYKYNSAQERLTEAQTLTGLSFWLTGKMGFRTKYQKKPTPQLVLETVSSLEAQPVLSHPPELVSLDFDQDNILHETPVLEEEAVSQTLTSPLDQCILLAVVQHQFKSRHSDEIQREVIEAYIDSTLKQSLDWLVYSLALLYRSRNQFQNYKTKCGLLRERSALQLQALVDQFRDAEPSAKSRLRFYFACDYPLRYWQHLELGEMWMRLGCVASALQIFETVEMHEEAIECLMITEQLNKAKELALERMQVAVTPRLLCTLGDITDEGQYYERAWEVSDGRCSRAQRTLARKAFERQDFDSAADHYSKALTVNPLFQSAWFTYGCTLMKLEKWSDATHAFVHVVSLDDTQADAWNNLAACHIREGRPEESFIALEQGVRHNRNSWKVWENLLNVSVQLRKASSVLQAFEMLIDLKHFASIEDSVLRVMWVIGAKEGKYAKVVELFNKYSNSTSPGPFFWKVYADLLCGAQQPLNQSEIVQLRLKACRSLMKIGWETDKSACENLIPYLIELANAYTLLSEDPAKVEGRLFVHTLKTRIETVVGQEIPLPLF